MKRDMEYVRELLLKIEDGNGEQESAHLLPSDATRDDLAKLNYHLQMLVDEAGLVRGIPTHHMQGKSWIEVNLTWSGHEFLDTIRDPEVWKNTKEGARKVGNFSIEFLYELAKAYGKHVVKERLGFDLP